MADRIASVQKVSSTKTPPQGKGSKATAGAGSKLNKIDDAIKKVVNPADSVREYYKTNSVTLDAAALALVNLTASDGLKRAAKDVLAPVYKIMEGLDAIAGVHPFLAAGILLFKAVVKIELARRENDRRTLSLVLQMADMMGTLLQLKKVQDPTLATDSGETVIGRIQQLMGNIENDIKECGQAIDAYRKQALIVKFLKAPMWATRLVEIGEGLGERKKDIQYALTIHTAVTVDSIKTTTDEMQTKLDQVLKYVVETRTPAEKEWEKEMEKLGGRDACLSDPAKMSRIAKILADRDPDDFAADLSKGGSDKPDGLNASMKQALSAKVEDLIKDNSLLYSRKLDQQTKQIEAAIQNSTNIILTKMGSGPHERIKHPVIKQVWEEMKWRSSVKARTFVLSLHDFYLDQGIKAEANQDAPNRDETNTPNPGNPNAPPVAKNELIHNPDDDWCLQYITVFNVPAIMEAFDDDASGWVKIKEVNDYTDGIPPKWNLLKSLAYWAAGWRVEIIKYCRRILCILHMMVEIQTDVLPENNVEVIEYMSQEDLVRVKTFIRLAHLELPGDDNLHELVEERMNESIKKWEEELAIGKYEIDSADSLTQLSGGHRIESYVFPLLYVLLRHHFRIMRLARTKVLNEMELQTAAMSIAFVVEAVLDRKKNLEESFRQQRLHPAVQFRYFAGGAFASFGDLGKRMDYLARGDQASFYDECDEEEDRLLEEPKLKEDQLKYDVCWPDAEGYDEPWPDPELAPEDLEEDIPRPRALFRMAVRVVIKTIVPDRRERRTWASMKKRRDLRLEYLKIALKYQTFETFVGDVEDEDETPAFPPTTDEENERMGELERDMDQRDLDLYHSLVDLALRAEVKHVGLRCDGCRTDPPMSLRYRCVECDDFDFCERCFKNPPKEIKSGNTTHNEKHSMIKFPWPLQAGLTKEYKSRSAQIVGDPAGLASHDRQYCDGCSANPIIGTRYHCIDCYDFDYCSECQKTPPKENNSGNDSHTPEHDMVAVPLDPKCSMSRPYTTLHVRWGDDDTESSASEKSEASDGASDKGSERPSTPATSKHESEKQAEDDKDDKEADKDQSIPDDAFPFGDGDLLQLHETRASSEYHSSPARSSPNLHADLSDLSDEDKGDNSDSDGNKYHSRDHSDGDSDKELNEEEESSKREKSANDSDSDHMGGMAGLFGDDDAQSDSGIPAVVKASDSAPARGSAQSSEYHSVPHTGAATPRTFHSDDEEEPTAKLPSTGKIYACHAGCKKTELTAYCLCLDCQKAFISCEECDAKLIKRHAEHVEKRRKIPTIIPASEEGVKPEHEMEGKDESLKDDDEKKDEDEKKSKDEKKGEDEEDKEEGEDDEDYLESDDDEDGDRHIWRHSVLIIKMPEKVTGDVEGDEAMGDHGVLIKKLREEVKGGFGAMNTRIGKLETLLGKLLAHLGVSDEA